MGCSVSEVLLSFVATQPEDYFSLGRTDIIFSANTAAGETATAPVRINDDTNFEPTEYFTVSIVPNPLERIDTIEGRGTATAFIIDDDSESLMHDTVSIDNHKVFLRYNIWIQSDHVQCHGRHLLSSCYSQPDDWYAGCQYY